MQILERHKELRFLKVLKAPKRIPPLQKVKSVLTIKQNHKQEKQIEIDKRIVYFIYSAK